MGLEAHEGELDNIVHKEVINASWNKLKEPLRWEPVVCLEYNNSSSQQLISTFHVTVWMTKEHCSAIY